MLLKISCKYCKSYALVSTKNEKDFDSTPRQIFQSTKFWICGSVIQLKQICQNNRSILAFFNFSPFMTLILQNFAGYLANKNSHLSNKCQTHSKHKLLPAKHNKFLPRIRITKISKIYRVKPTFARWKLGKINKFHDS